MIYIAILAGILLVVDSIAQVKAAATFTLKDPLMWPRLVCSVLVTATLLYIYGTSFQ